VHLDDQEIGLVTPQRRSCPQRALEHEQRSG
jgi:hypothetical protein